MSHRLRQGWRITKRHFKINILLFFYQALWGFLLFRMIDHIVSPLLLRYPAITDSPEALQLFWAEAQFQLLKTDLLVPYVYTMLALLLLRMLITPVLQSGIFYSIHAMSNGEQHSSFRKGIRSCWKPMLLLYWIKNLAIIAPMIWLIAPVLNGQENSSALLTVLQTSKWVWLAFLLWAVVINLIGYMMQLGVGAGLSIVESITSGLKHLGKILIIGALILTLYGAVSVSIHALSMLWVTFISFVLYQLLPLIRSTCKLWLVSAQYSAINDTIN